MGIREVPGSELELTVQMKSVGETMAIGRTMKESLQKALRGLEIGHFGLGGGKKDLWGTDEQPTQDEIEAGLSRPNSERIFSIRYAMKAGMSVEEIYAATNIDPWFLRHIRDLLKTEREIQAVGRLANVTKEQMRTWNARRVLRQTARLVLSSTEIDVRARRKELGVVAVFKQVDTCAAEFPAYTPYYYSTYERKTRPHRVGASTRAGSGCSKRMVAPSR